MVTDLRPYEKTREADDLAADPVAALHRSRSSGLVRNQILHGQYRQFKRQSAGRQHQFPAGDHCHREGHGRVCDDACDVCPDDPFDHLYHRQGQGCQRFQPRYVSRVGQPSVQTDVRPAAAVLRTAQHRRPGSQIRKQFPSRQFPDAGRDSACHQCRHDGFLLHHADDIQQHDRFDLSRARPSEFLCCRQAGGKERDRFPCHVDQFQRTEFLCS